MREKLIKLIKEGECGALGREDCSYCKYDGEDDCSYQLLADVLLANGVVVREKGEWDDSGRYKFANGGKAIRCPFCGACISEEEYELYFWNFCPNCGADMRKGENG